MPFDAYFETLFRMAAKKPISVFKQGVHAGDTPQAVTDPRRPGQTWKLPTPLYQQVKGGFCSGASLDWLRKVLQREDRKGVDHLKQSRVTRMAQTYVKNKELSKQIIDAKTDRLREQAKGLTTRAAGVLSGPTAAKEALEQDVAAWVRANGGVYNSDGTASIEGTAQVVGMFKDKMAELKAVKQELSQAIDSHNDLIGQANALYGQSKALTAEWNAASSAGKRAMIWNELARDLGTDAGKTRKLQGITPVASSGRENYATLRDFLVPALSAPTLSPGRGMLIGISLKPPPGHAIALHRDGTGAVLLFDPNLGVYKFTDLKLLVFALVVLIEVGYVGKNEKNEVTELGSDHDWQVFAKTDAFLPVSTARPYASAEDVMRAYDNAVDTIAMSAEFARDSLDGSLREAQRLHAAYEAKKGPDTQRAWVDAHNEAVAAFRQMRGADKAHAKSIYARIVNSNGDVATLSIT